MEITVDYLLKKGFKEIGNDLGAAHYRKVEYKKGDILVLEIRHTQDNNRWWLTNGKSCYDIYRELYLQKEVDSLIDFFCFTK